MDVAHCGGTRRATYWNTKMAIYLINHSFHNLKTKMAMWQWSPTGKQQDLGDDYIVRTRITLYQHTNIIYLILRDDRISIFLMQL